MELKELVVGAQEAMDGGDFRLALAANTHALKAYPACLAAHRMVGEAYLERGDRESAVKHFERTLQIDPLNVVARLGLGVAAEESKQFQAAYAHYLHAWEINPALDQVRDELVRLRGLLNVEDRLHPTRAGLAGIHARAGQFRRAVGEWKAVLAVEPESRRGRTALAELLWRSGDDHGAAHAAREALRGSPDNARALAILADVERRRDGAAAEELAQRYAQVDPTGDTIAVLQPWRIDADLSFLKVDSAPLDDFDFEAFRSRDTGPLGIRKTATASLASSHLGAPDLWDTLVKDLATDLPHTSQAPTLATGVEPFNWNEGKSAPEPEVAATAQAMPMVELADRVFGAAGDATADPNEDAENVVAPVAEPAAADHAEVPAEAELVSAMAIASNDATGMNPDSLNDFIRGMATEAPPGSDHLAPAEASNMAAFMTETDAGTGVPPSYAYPVTTNQAAPATLFASDRPSNNGVELQGMGPVNAPKPASADGGRGGAFIDPFVTADGQIDLTQGWDELDRALADATPSLDGADGFDALLADLDGIQPFDAVSEGDDEDAWAPLFDDAFAAEPVASAPSADAPGPVDPETELQAGAMAWFDDSTADNASLTLPAEDEIQPPASIDTYPSVIEAVVTETEPKDATGELLDFADLEAFDATPFLAEADPKPVAIESEIVTGIPEAKPSGYTELLRNVDEESLAMSESLFADVDPFAIPDGAGAPLDFDELLEVTSSDGTGPLVAEPDDDADVESGNPFDFAADDLDAALPPVLAADPGLELDGILPFDSAMFDEQGSTDDPVGFGEVDGAAEDAEQGAMAEFDVEPFAPEIRPFGYTDALSALEEEPFDFSDVVVESDPEPVAELEGNESDAPLAFEPIVEPAVGELDQDALEAEAAGLGAESAESGAEVKVEQPGWAGKAGMGTVARTVLWPTFINQTSELMDRALETEDLFERIIAEKESMVAQGIISASRRVATATANVSGTAVELPPAAEPGPAPSSNSPGVAAPVMSEQTRLDLMAMRIRLVEDDGAAPEIAAALEQALAEGLLAPLALRVLGEAYLKMGLVERAAALFRQAMLARRRASQES